MQKEKQIIMVLGISLLCVGNSAQAEKLSDIQEGALYDAVGVLLLQHILKSRSERVDEGYAYSGFGRSHPVDPVQRAYEEGVRERREADQRERAARGYECGRWGRSCEEIG